MSWWKNTWEKLTDWDRNPIYTSVRDEHDAITEKMINAYLKWDAFGDQVAGAIVRHSIKTGSAEHWQYPTLRDKAIIGWFIGKTAVPELIKIVETKGGYAKSKACLLLGRTKDPRAVPALIEAFMEEDVNVLEYTYLAVIEILGPEKAEKTLRECLKDDRWEIRRTAAKGIGAMARYMCKGHKFSEETVDELMRILEDDMSAVSQEACFALGDVGNPKAIPALFKSYKRETNAWARELAIIQVATIKGFQNSEDEALEKIESGNMEEREMAAIMLRGLARFRAHKLSDKAIPALSKALDDEALEVKKEAALSLAGIGGTEAVEGMLKSLEIIDKDVWGNAIPALHKIEPTREHLRLLHVAARRIRKVGKKVIGRPYTAKDMPTLMNLHTAWAKSISERVQGLVQKNVIPAKFRPKSGKPQSAERMCKLMRAVG